MDGDLIVRLQSVARGWLVRKNFKKIAKNCLDERVELLVNTEKTEKHVILATEILRMGKFLMEEYTKEDNLLLTKFCRLLLASMDLPKDQNFSYLLLNKATIADAHRVLTWVVSQIPEILHSFSGLKLSEIKMWQSLVHFLVVYSSANGWTVVKTAPQVQVVLNGLCQKIISPLYSEANYLKFISSLYVVCNGERPVVSETAVNAMFGLIFKPFREERQEELLQTLVTKILTIPAIIIHLNKLNKDSIVNSKIFVKVLTYLRSHPDNFDKIEPQRLIYLMSNIIELGCWDEEGTKEKIADWTWVLGMAMVQCTEFAVRPGERSSHNHWHPIFGNYRLPIDTKAEGALKNVVKQLRLLWSGKVVSSLFDMCLSGVSPSKNVGKDSTKEVTAQFSKLWKRLGGGNQETEAKEEPPSLTAIVCKVYVSALANMHHLKHEIISGICHNDRILCRLWSYLVSWGQSTPSQDPPPLSAALRVISHPGSPHIAPLHLFAEASSTIFQILDEEEMYEKGTPFSINELLSIAKFCNAFCFRVIWNGMTHTENMEGTLFGAMHTLTGLLYSRDCRRSFTSSPKFWLSPDVKSGFLINEYEKKTARGLLIMEKLSHCISLRDRMLLFRKFVNDEKATIDAAPSLITVVRTRLIEDGYHHLSSWTPAKLKSTVRVKFVNQQGLEEAGIDQDGVFKEFLELSLKEVFAPTLNLFRCTTAGVLYPSPTSFIHENHLALFQFVGRLLAKAVYEGIVVDVQLAPVLLSAVLGASRNYFWAFDELAQLDHELYKNLTFVKRYDGDVSDLALTFSIDDDYLGKVVTTDLVPGGRAISVTNENRIDYVHKMARHRVFIQTREQCKSFVLGIKSILNPQWLSLFAPHELQYLISGHSADIDVNDLKKNVQYFGGFHGSHRVIKWLWDIVERDFSKDERKLFLKFVTSCSKPPLLGFSYLEPPFAIRCVETSDDQDQGDTLGSVLRGFLTLRKNQSATRLPTASTCFNLLKLPNYNKKSILLSKLRYAIHAESGFELS